MHVENRSQGLAPIILLLLLFMGYQGNNVEGIAPATLDHRYSNENELALHVFFTPNDLKVGKTMSLYLGGNLFPGSTPSFLSKETAELIPLSSSQLPFLLDLFEFRKGSPQAEAVEDSLIICEEKTSGLGSNPMKICATSLESMLDFVHRVLGTDHATPQKTLFMLPGREPNTQVPYLQNFTIVEEPRARAAPKMVGCHMLTYPYALFYCHNLQGDNKVYDISLSGEDGAKLQVIAVCHMNTSHMNPNYVGFRFLGINVGEAFCHVFPVEDLVWLPSLSVVAQS